VEYTIDILKSIALENSGKLLSDSYIGSKGKYRWQCKYEHTFDKSFNNVMQGQWCPVCSSGKSERFCRFCFEELFSAEFPKRKDLDWLRNSRGNKMELDGYSEKLGIAFEYQGKQHSEHIPHFHKNDKDFILRINDDKQKNELCESNGVKLISVPFELSIYEFEDYIKSKCKEIGIEIAENSNIDYSHYNFEADGILQEMKDIAISKGGECISTACLNSQDMLEFFCNIHNHKWKAAPYSIRQGKWCKYCGYIKSKEKDPRVLTIKDLKEFAISKGGKCLSKVYSGKNELLTWKCKNPEHPIYKAKPNSVRISKFLGCMACSGKKRLVNDDMRFHAKKHGGKCITEELNNLGKTIIEFECALYPEHPRFRKKASEIKNNPKLWCPRCEGGKINRHSLQFAQELAIRNKCECLSTEYKTIYTPMNWKCCECNYTFTSLLKNLQRKDKLGLCWCNKCVALKTVREKKRK